MAQLFARYMTVGVLNTLIHWVTFAICIKNGQPQSLSNFIAFCLAVTFSFFVNAKWTFRAKVTTIRYMMYVFFMGALATLVGYCGDLMKINPLITLVVFSAISLISGFLYSKYVIFREIK
ncbi:GtrA family protein [Pantoea agglomerans]|uniref:GtrA family protein n=1 Tax=Enterobacter agglomerans TaxID=549 RepID=UPI000E1B5D2C|nr:GtrA family protein [Pantoea agglomerans]NKE95521.1 GtrA family protein [Pantoea agglomerans]TRO77048.1 GtrA family protein [Pantoea agglomerans]